MHISPTASGPVPGIHGGASFARVRQAFQSLATALDAGNLSDAKAAFAELQRNAPPQPVRADNPIASKIVALGKALQAGDIKSARDAYAEIQKMASQRGRGGGPGGPASGGGGRPAAGEGDLGTAKITDPKDTNQDGKISTQEQQAYDATHAQVTTKPAEGADSGRSGRLLEVWA